VNPILSQHLERIVFALLEDTNTPRSLTIACLIRAGEWEQLFSLKVNPSLYLCAETFFKDNVVTEFLRKLQANVRGINRKKVALTNFWDSERQCCRTNVRLSRYINNQGPFEDLIDVRMARFIESVRKIIDEWLGKIPMDLQPRHGPGATFEDRGQLSTVPDKMSSRPTITQEARHLLPLWVETAWARALLHDNSTKSDPKTIRGNRFTTVPKDAMKDRGICIEPSLNIFYQLAVGGEIRSRLKRVGIDLKHGKHLHMALARGASRYGTFATIDLSNASDTVSYNLVKALLPEAWFDILDVLRSPMTHVNGKWVKLEKFSSMGNGYTFELETLIFAALAQACANEMGVEVSPLSGIWVYGDDIIVPTSVAGTLLACLQYFGFTPNSRKTFVSGCFRESCGGDYFDGVLVRAHYVETDPTEPQHFIALANGIRRMAFGHDPSRRNWARYRRAWLRCLDALPSSIRRLRGPSSLGDLVIHDDRWSTVEGTGNKSGWTLLRGYVPVTETVDWHHWKPGVVLASALLGFPGEGVAPRGSVTGYRVKWISCLEQPVLQG